MPDSLERLATALNDKYRIEREIGRGGMALVYLAEDLKHRRRVAVKVVNPDITHALGSERFLREIEIAAQLAHPNILPLYDSGTADGMLFYAMPYVEGDSLRARLDREKQLPLEVALQIAREVADALAYAHSKGVVHRDIKPENVFFQSGHAVVSDFGIARAIGKAGGERLTETGLAVGTPTYMSPEQASGEYDIDARTDVYSLGCMLYEILAGNPPFVGANAQAILARKLVEPVPSLRVVRDAVPLAVEDVILKALARVPADRFATATQFNEALELAVSSPAIHATSRRMLTRGRVAAVIAAATALLAGGAWWESTGFAGLRTDRVGSMAVLPFENLSGDSAQDYFVAGMHDALIAELSQIGALRVISRRSVLRYQKSDKSIPEIARELNVDGIVEGSVAKAGDSVRVRVQLIAAAPNERNLWTQAYHANVLSVPGLYGGVARAIARAARVKTTPQEETRLGSDRRVNPKTYEAYLRGMFYINKGGRDRSSVQRGLAYLHEAIEHDPGDPYAYSGLALGYGMLGHGPAAQPEYWPRARAAALRAVTLDSTLAEAHAAVAEVKLYYEWDWVGAENSFRRALELNPSLAMAHYHHAWFLALLGRFSEAIVAHKRAQELDPLTPLHTAWLGGLYLYTGQYDEAIAEAQRSLVLTPDFGPGLLVLGKAYIGQRRYPEAIAAHERLVATNPVWEWELGVTYAQAGRTSDARKILGSLETAPASPFLAYGLISLSAALRENDKAFRWMAYEPPHAFLPWVAVDPDLAGLRADPRFAAMRRRLKLPA